MTEPFTYVSIRFTFHSFCLGPQQRILHKSCEHEFPAVKVLFLWQKFFSRELTSTCLFNHVCSFQTAFQGDEMIPLSAIIVQRSPTPPTPGTTRLTFSVSSLGVEPVSAALESAFPPGPANLNTFACLLMNCSPGNCLFPLSTFLLALKNLFFFNFQEPLVYYRYLSFVICFTSIYFSKLIIFILFVYGFFFHRKFNIPTKSHRSTPLL